MSAVAAVIRSADWEFDSRLQRTEETLRKLGYQVALISWQRSGLTVPPAEGRASFGLVHVSAYGAGLKTLPGYVKWLLHQYRILRRIRPVLIVGCDLDGAMVSALTAAGIGAKWIFDQYDPYAGRAKTRAGGAVLRRIEALAAARADARIVASPRRRRGAFEDADVVGNAPMWVPTRPPRGRRRTLFYGGVLASDRGLEIALHAVEGCHGWRLVVCGHGPQAEFAERAMKEGRPLEFLGPLPHSLLLMKMAECEIVLATYDPAVSANRHTASNKIIEAAMLERPVLTSSGTAAAETVQDYGTGFVVDYGDADQLAQVLRALDGATQSAVTRQNFQRLVADRGWSAQEAILSSVVKRVSSS